jgi:SAM-dependent methyltransferase
MRGMSEGWRVATLILYQRTELQWRNKLGHVGSLLPYKLCVTLEALIRSRQIIRRYSEVMLAESKQLLPFLPGAATRILDIGCGIGGINEFLYNRYKDSLTELYLADRNEIRGRIYYGFHPRASAYNSLSLTESYLVGRGVPKDILHSVDVGRKALPDNIDFDIILSLLSWGFHYPIYAYLEYVKYHLARDGVLIIDCQKDTDGITTLEKHFTVSIIEVTSKFTRVQCHHNQGQMP